MKNRKGREEQIEDAKMRWLKRYTDWVSRKLGTEDFDEASATEFLLRVREEILKKFPGKSEEYNLIYRRRFVRILLRRGIYLGICDDDSLN